MRKKNVTLLITITIALAASCMGCGETSGKAEDIPVTTIEITMDETPKTESPVEMSTAAEGQETASTEEGIESFVVTDDIEGDVYKNQGIVVRRSGKEGSDDSHYIEVIEVQNISDGTTFTYESKEGFIGQYDALNYAVCGNSILIIDTTTQSLHVFELSDKAEIVNTALNSFYNGGACTDDVYAYFQNADGSEVCKIDSKGNIIWEVDVCDNDHAGAGECGGVGGGGCLEIEGDVLHCYYDFGDYSIVDISKEDGSFISKTENE